MGHQSGELTLIPAQVHSTHLPIGADLDCFTCFSGMRHRETTVKRRSIVQAAFGTTTRSCQRASESSSTKCNDFRRPSVPAPTKRSFR